MNAGFYRIVLRRKTVGVKAYREKNIIALHSALSGDYLKTGISLDMADVHSRSAGIGKLNKGVELFLVGIILRVENAAVLPFFLPLFLCLFKVVVQVYHSVLY